ncbi:MAG TPA: hypothetical protein VGG33_15065 [Polyangia bacterium]
MQGAPDDRRLIVTLALLLVLAVAQAGAFAKQFVLGFRPFGTPPVRVPLSWDMFSTHIERCEIAWQPPLPTAQGSIDKLSQTSRPLEWFAVRATQGDYRALVQQGCARAQAPTTATLACWLPDGRRVEEAIRCP